MKRFRLITIFSIIFCLISILGISIQKVVADDAENDFVQYKKTIQKIIKSSGISMNDLGLYITDGNLVIYENKSKEKFIPASLSKILTAIAALKVFSPDQRNITELRSISEIKDGVLNGALYMKGFGDPSFVSEQMWVLVNNLTRNGIKKIKGPIIVDGTIFDDNFFDESRQDSRVDRAYDSPVSGLSFNWNTVNVYVRPGKKIGKPLDIHIDPENNYFSLINKTKTVRGNRSPVIIIDKAKDKEGEKIIVSGSMGINQSEAVKFASVTYPNLWAGKNLIQFLKQRGIVVENSAVLSEKVPLNSNLLASVKGWTFFEIISGMMKFSNNFLAEMLTKNIAIQNGSKPGSIKEGVALIKEILETNYELKSTEYDFFSPSGFSHENKISPENLGKLLSKAYMDFPISSYLLSSMAIPENEGTLSRRMSSLKQPSLVRAKTGLLSGVAGLAGYIGIRKGKVLSFVFVYNGKGKEAQARNLFDKIAVELAEQ